MARTRRAAAAPAAVVAASSRSAALAPILLTLPALAVFAWASVRLKWFMVDDVFISLRYGKHLLEGHGLVYNVGERVEGYTNFLWTLLAAPSVVVPIGVFGYLRILNGAFALLAAWQAGVLAARVAGIEERSQRIAWLALGASAFLLATPVIVSTAEGLETMLFACLLLFGMNAVLAGGRPVRAGLAFAALAMTRPDGVLFAGWAIGACAWLERPRGEIVRLALVAFGVFGLYWLARWAWYGQPLPNTFYAKGTGGAELFWRGWDEMVRFAVPAGGAALLLSLVPLFGGRRHVALLVLAAVLLRVAFQLWSGGPTQDRFRFLVPALPLVYALALAAAAGLARRPGPRIALACAVAALLLAPSWWTYRARDGDAQAYAASLLQAHWKLGQDLLSHTSPKLVLAMDDAGIAPLECDRTNVDMVGLNDRHMSHVPGVFGLKTDVPYVLSRRPDLVVLVARTPSPSADTDFWLPPHAAIFRDAAFRASYGFSRRYEFNRTYWLLVYRRHGTPNAPASFWGGEGGVDVTATASRP
jgi:hypothetical protein